MKFVTLTPLRAEVGLLSNKMKREDLLSKEPVTQCTVFKTCKVFVIIVPCLRGFPRLPDSITMEQPCTLYYTNFQSVGNERWPGLSVKL